MQFESFYLKSFCLPNVREVRKLHWKIWLSFISKQLWIRFGKIAWDINCSCTHSRECVLDKSRVVPSCKASAPRPTWVGSTLLGVGSRDFSWREVEISKLPKTNLHWFWTISYFGQKMVILGIFRQNSYKQLVFWETFDLSLLVGRPISCRKPKVEVHLK